MVFILTENPKTNALVIVDMQNDFVLPNAPATVKGAYTTIPKIKKLLDFFRQKKLPIIHIKRTYKADYSDVEITRIKEFKKGVTYAVEGTKGCEIIEDLQPLKEEKTVIKKRFSAFMNTELDKLLKNLGITDIILCGTQYPTCIRATVYDGISYNYNIILATDATSAASAEIAQANIYDLKNMGVTCLTVKEIMNIIR